MRANKKNVQLK